MVFWFIPIVAATYFTAKSIRDSAERAQSILAGTSKHFTQTLEDLKKMAEGMDIQGGVTAFKSSLQVFEHSLLHFEEVIEEANLPGVSRTIAQTAQVFQQNFTIITVTIILVAIAYTLRTEPEPRWFLVVCFNTPAAGISIKGRQAAISVVELDGANPIGGLSSES